MTVLRVAVAGVAVQLFLAACARTVRPPADEPIAALDSAIQSSEERWQDVDRHRQNVDAALRAHYADLLRGRALPQGARAIWFVGDPSGAVIATGTRAALPDTVGFYDVPTLVPEVGARPYGSISLMGAGPTGAAADVSVLWIELTPTR